MYYIGTMPCDPNYLEHYGIKGQKRGVRRFQNADRTWTEEGKIRYGHKGELKDKESIEKRVGKDNMDRIVYDSWSRTLDDMYDDYPDMSNASKKLTKKYERMEKSRELSYSQSSKELDEKYYRDAKAFQEEYKNAKLRELVRQQPKKIRSDVRDYIRNYWWDNP